MHLAEEQNAILDRELEKGGGRLPIMGARRSEEMASSSDGGGRRSAMKSRQGEILTDPSGQGGDLHMGVKTPVIEEENHEKNENQQPITTVEQAMESTRFQRLMKKQRSLVMAMLGEVQHRSENLQDVFHEQDSERKVLVLRIEELEKELHLYDPGHEGVNHHDERHRSHHLNQIRNERDLLHEKRAQQSPLQKSITTSGTSSPSSPTSPSLHNTGKSPTSSSDVLTRVGQHPLNFPVKKNGELDLDAHTATSRRRPSVIRSHKTVGLF
jgi:hypothetical protein